MQMLNDLTIFDRNLSREDLQRFECIKCLYFVGMIGCIIVFTLGAFGSLITFNIIEIAIFGFDFLSVILSIFYVCYPKSKIARSKKSFVVIILSICCIIALVSIDVEQFNTSHIEYFKAVFYLITAIYVVLPLTYLICVFFIWKGRWQIARDFNRYRYVNQGNMNPNYVNHGYIDPHNPYQPLMDQNQNNGNNNGGYFHRIVGYQADPQHNANIYPNQENQIHNRLEPS